ncbi:hypothetical protein [Mucilaginibacter psychrotolerans]|uniref:Uncharacterized protein n=1 Tax=Mucilaginibacter psychrotolerans TaxID=1524096 RepID=A0A4Y8S474_9SPHI|nr:hypothetical protein [Mucilaginibacter psychrotolerans]TFF33267.1 hypothetical protein E2R66_26680 [Mucilaginibacter psychrotolerans]
MKKLKLNVILSTTLILGVVTLLSSCSKSITFQKSVVVPSAVGTVKIGKDDNGNRQVTIKVENLVAPSRLTPERKLYIVWVQTKDNGTKSLGKLVSSEAWFSSERNAKFISVLNYDPVRFFITAENDADVTNPSGVTVISTSDF